MANLASQGDEGDKGIAGSVASDARTPPSHRIDNGSIELQGVDSAKRRDAFALRGTTPIGIAMSVPDLNEALRSVDGRLCRFGLPIGYFRLRAAMKRIRTCRLFLLGIHPEHRHHSPHVSC